MPHEIITVDNETVSCDGGGDTLGHPRVYLTINDHGFVDCGYCGRHYVKACAQETIVDGNPSSDKRRSFHGHH
jgi:uncharacterized Zn-finger protein